MLLLSSVHLITFNPVLVFFDVLHLSQSSTVAENSCQILLPKFRSHDSKGVVRLATTLLDV